MPNIPDGNSYEGRMRERRKQRRSRLIAYSIFRPPDAHRIRKDLWNSALYPTALLKSGVPVQVVELELWRAMRRRQLGSWAALLDTLSACLEASCPLPSWTVEPLLEHAPGALFGAANERKSLPGLRRAELSRLTKQKVSQVFYAIKDHENTFPGAGRSYLSAARMPREVLEAGQALAVKATNDAQRFALTHKLLRQSQGSFGDCSEQTVKRHHRELRNDVERQFGVNLGKRLSPALFLWDITFVRPTTVATLTI